MVLASSKGFNSIIAIRFFIGKFPSSFLPRVQLSMPSRVLIVLEVMNACIL